MRKQYITFIAVLSLLAMCAGCAGGNIKATRYYLIDPVSYEQDLESVSPLRIEIIDLHIPQYLERFHIATRVSENRLVFSESHQWGENLRKNLLRTLAGNLSGLLNTNDIGTPLNRSASSPDYRLQVYIEKFERDSDYKVRLLARWQLSVADMNEPVGVFSRELVGAATLQPSDYDAMVSSMRQLYGQLCQHIADSIMAEEQQASP